MDLIDEKPMRPGWGQIWQGGEFADIDHIPQPMAAISLVGCFIHLYPCLAVYLNDNDSATLTDAQLIAFVRSAIAFLSLGMNLYIHCFEGKYRSTYLDVAVHMAVMKYPYAQAFGYVKQRHPIAEMRLGTKGQLWKLEPNLKDLPIG